ncbi:MAG: PEP-CTERM sorting domain-containing protein [Terriglobales bacterium]
MNRFGQCLAGLGLVVLAAGSALHADTITPSNLTFAISGYSAPVGENVNCAFFSCPTVTSSGPSILPSLFDPGTGNAAGAVNLSNGGGTYVLSGGLNADGTSANFNADGTVTGTLVFPIPIAYNFTVTTDQPWAFGCLKCPVGVQNDPSVDWDFQFEVTDADGNQYFTSVNGFTPDGTVIFDPFAPIITSTVTSTPGASLSPPCFTYNPPPGGPPCPTSVPLLAGSTWSSTLSFTLASNTQSLPGPTGLEISDPFALNTLTAPGEVTPTPEPASLWLFGVGTFALLGLAIRRRALIAGPPR